MGNYVNPGNSRGIWISFEQTFALEGFALETFAQEGLTETMAFIRQKLLLRSTLVALRGKKGERSPSYLAILISE